MQLDQFSNDWPGSQNTSLYYSAHTETIYRIMSTYVIEHMGILREE